MEQRQIDNIWNKTYILINHFKKYNLEKRISKVAIEHVNIQIAEEKRRFEEEKQKSREDKSITEIETAAKNALIAELMASQIKEVAIQRLQTQLQKMADDEKKSLEDKAIIEDIETVSKNALTAELMASQIKDIAIQSLQSQLKEEQERLLLSKKSLEEKAIIENIETVSKNALISELIASQIKETAIQSVQSQLKEEHEQKIVTEQEEKIKTLAKQTIIKFIEKHISIIQPIIAIKKAAIDAVNKNANIESIEQQLLNLADEFNNLNIAMNEAKNNEERKTIEKKLNETLEQLNQSLESHNILAKNITDKDKQNTALKKENDILSKINNANIKSQMPYLVRLENELAALKQTNLQKELENVAIKEVLSSLPKVAESKIDVKPLIENVAINELKDELRDLVNNAIINDLKTGITAKDLALKNLIEANVKRDLEEIAKKVVTSATTSSATSSSAETGSVAVASASSTINIENDLKNTALTALYSALLGLPREPREPIDISKPPAKFDILITDKTYEYDKKKGERKEIPELTKYDSILEKQQK